MGESRSGGPGPGVLAALVGLAVVHGGWALFQWTQLVVARSGGDSFCGFGDDPVACVSVWDSAFASSVHAYTGVPVAGWGLIWSVAAVALPLLALLRLARGEAVGAAGPATLVAAAAGLVTVPLLLLASVLSGSVCTTCVVTYVLVFAYGGLAFVQTRLAEARLASGLPLAAAAVAAAWLVFLLPGLRTPESSSAAERRVMDEIAATSVRTPEADGAPAPASPTDPVAAVSSMIESMPPDVAQSFADVLGAYAEAPEVPVREPRALIGDASAPVRVTVFSDALCGHCAQLHTVLERLEEMAPQGAFAIEERHFPLDSACNPQLEGESRNPVRCRAALAEICLEDRPGAFDFAGRIYADQRSLDDDKIFAFAAEAGMDREALEICMADPATGAALADDIDWAMEHGIEGTPLVLINGRKTVGFGPLIFGLVMTGGDASHPAFASLPPPRPFDPHAGHGH